MSKSSRAKTEQMRAEREEAARKQQSRRRLVAILGGLVILVLIGAIAWVAVDAAKSNDDSPGNGSGELVIPNNLNGDGAIPVGDDSAPVEVEIYFDYICPACGAFELANGAELDRLLEDGSIHLALRPIAFLDKFSSGTEYSTRAANAMATVIDGAPEAVWDFHGAMYVDQPAEGSEGRTDEEIAEIALEAGVPQEVVDRFEDQTFVPWVVKVTDEAFESIDGTPTVRLDGEDFEGDVYTPGPLTEAIEAKL